MNRVIITFAICLTFIQANAQIKQSNTREWKLIDDFMIHGDTYALDKYLMEDYSEKALPYVLFALHHYGDESAYYKVYSLLMYMYTSRNIQIDSTMYELALNYLIEGATVGCWACAYSLADYYFWGCMSDAGKYTTIKVEQDTIKTKYYYKLYREPKYDSLTMNISLDSFLNKGWQFIYGKYLNDSILYENKRKERCDCNSTSNK